MPEHGAGRRGHAEVREAKDGRWRLFVVDGAGDPIVMAPSSWPSPEDALDQLVRLARLLGVLTPNVRRDGGTRLLWIGSGWLRVELVPHVAEAPADEA